MKVKDAKRVLLFGSGRVAKPLMRLLGEVSPESLVLPLLVSSSVLFSAIFPPSESLVSSHLSHLPIPLFPTSPSFIPYLFLFLSLFLLPSFFSVAPSFPFTHHTLYTVHPQHENVHITVASESESQAEEIMKCMGRAGRRLG